jgi:hypothetical protein
MQNLPRPLHSVATPSVSSPKLHREAPHRLPRLRRRSPSPSPLRRPLGSGTASMLTAPMRRIEGPKSCFLEPVVTSACIHATRGGHRCARARQSFCRTTFVRARIVRQLGPTRHPLRLGNPSVRTVFPRSRSDSLEIGPLL